ncbi:hypothetical protein JCM31271_05890 [Halorubrum trueperi]
MRSLALGLAVTAAGGVLATLVVIAVAFGASLLDGTITPSSTWAVFVVLLVGGPMSVLYWLVAYDRTSPERRSELRSQFGDYSFNPARFRIGWTFAGAGVAAAFAAASVGPSPVPSSVFSGIAPLFLPLLVFLPTLAGSRGTDVRLVPAAEAVERTYRTHDRTRTDDLGSAIRIRRIDLFPTETTLFLLAYRGNAWYRSTPWLFIPNRLADEVEAALADVLARSDGPDRASTGERIVLALLGSSSLLVGIAMAIAAGEQAAGVLLALLTAPFSALFLALAARL